MTRLAREAGVRGHTTMGDCELHRALTAHYGGLHPTEWPGAAGALGRAAHRPRKDAYHRTYLTNRDLSRILSQYAAADPTFELVGVVPIDFCDVGYGAAVCDLRLERLVRAGRRRAAVVFNTEPSDEPGEHWVLLWIDVSGGVGAALVAYVDSEGADPPPRIARLMRRLRAQADTARRRRGPCADPDRGPRPRTVSVVERAHQRGGTLCGVYVVHFVERLLGGAPLESLSGVGGTRVTHKAMHEFRRRIMSPGFVRL